VDQTTGPCSNACRQSGARPPAAHDAGDAQLLHQPVHPIKAHREALTGELTPQLADPAR